MDKLIVVYGKNDQSLTEVENKLSINDKDEESIPIKTCNLSIYPDIEKNLFSIKINTVSIKYYLSQNLDNLLILVYSNEKIIACFFDIETFIFHKKTLLSMPLLIENIIT